MTSKHTAPAHNAKAFHCPHCGIYATQQWLFLNVQPAIDMALCTACNKETLWREKQLIYPLTGSAPTPHAMLGEKCYYYYNMARSVSVQSPPAACAFLRKAVAELFLQLGGKGLNPDEDVDDFISRDLGSHSFWQPFRTARVIGFDKLAPLVIDEQEDEAMAGLLFYLINQLVEETIANPMVLADFYAKLTNKDKKEPVIDPDFYERS